MNKTITMNLSGIVFHIDEDAYEKLNKYLSTIKGYFQNSESRDEIMNDIEARIAEMLQEKVSTNKQAILLEDINTVINIMGKPEDYIEGQEEETKNTFSNNTNSNEGYNRRRRVFRDPDDKIIGGVCSGIANYFDFDPIWLRGLFAISFFVFGSGFLLYIILLIIIPKAKTTAEKLEMRGEKINIDNIGKTVTEEFNDFKNRVKDFGEDVASEKNKRRMKHSADKAGDFFKELFYNIFSVIGKIFSVILIVLGVLLMTILLASIFGSDVFHFNIDDVGFSYSLYDFVNAFFPDTLPVELAIIGVLLFIGIPIISIIYSGIRFLFGIKYKNKIIGYTTTTLWLIGLVVIIYVGVEVSNNFSKSTTNKQVAIIENTTSDILYLSMNKNSKYGFEEDLYNRSDSHIRLNDWVIFKKDKDILKFGYPRLDIEPSDNENTEIVIIKVSKGASKKEATYRAKSIDYHYTQNDSLISFEPYFSINNDNKWRGQKIKIILKLPINKTVYLDKSLKNMIDDIDNIHNVWDGDMINRKWIMTKDGLNCLDCKGLEDNDGDAIAPPSPPVAPEVL